MATVNLVWSVQSEAIPNAATFTQYDVQLLQGTPPVVVPGFDATEPLGATTHTFLNVPPGDYIASVVEVDPSNNQAAPPITAAFTVPAVATTPVPVTPLTVTLA